MKHHSLKSLLKPSAIFGLALLMGGCVSTRTYREAVAARENIEKRHAELQAEHARLQAANDALSTTATDRQRALNEKEASLRLEEARMKEMKELIDAQGEAIRNLKQQVCNALKCFTPDELTVEVREGKLYVSLSDKLLFPSGSDRVNDRGREAIALLAAVLANSDLEILVEGHTDNVPIHNQRNMDNWDLSVHRATSVTRILLQNGIPAQRIIPGGRGEFHPLASNGTAEGRQSNRRTEIVLAPKLDKLWKLTEQVELAGTSK
jgi:chemotaxis protein MotB